MPPNPPDPQGPPLTVWEDRRRAFLDWAVTNGHQVNVALRGSVVLTGKLSQFDGDVIHMSDPLGTDWHFEPAAIVAYSAVGVDDYPN